MPLIAAQVIITSIALNIPVIEVIDIIIWTYAFYKEGIATYSAANRSETVSDDFLSDVLLNISPRNFRTDLNTTFTSCAVQSFTGRTKDIGVIWTDEEFSICRINSGGGSEKSS